MAARGSALSRAVRYFQEAEYEEASYVLQRATEIMRKRMASQGENKPEKVKKTSRTKSQIAEAKQAQAQFDAQNMRDIAAAGA